MTDKSTGGLSGSPKAPKAREPKPKGNARADRLAEALRANLRRRKSQDAARREDEVRDGPVCNGPVCDGPVCDEKDRP